MPQFSISVIIKSIQLQHNAKPRWGLQLKINHFNIISLITSQFPVRIRWKEKKEKTDHRFSKK